MTPEARPRGAAPSPSAPLPSAPRLLASTDDHAFGLVGNVVVASWRRRATSRGVEVARLAFSEAQQVAGGPLALLGTAEPDAGLPESAVREQLAAVMRERGEDLLTSAFIIPGDGFRAAAVRSVTTGLAILVRARFPYRIFADVGPAAAWLVGELRSLDVPAPSVTGLVSGFDALRRAPVAR